MMMGSCANEGGVKPHEDFVERPMASHQAGVNQGRNYVGVSLCCSRRRLPSLSAAIWPMNARAIRIFRDSMDPTGVGLVALGVVVARVAPALAFSAIAVRMLVVASGSAA